MSSTTESHMRRESADYAYLASTGGHEYDMSGSGGGPFTVFFRLVSTDHSPGHHIQPITPLHTPFTQSPVQSPVQSSVHVPLSNYPIPSPTLAPIGSPPSAMPLPATGVFYTTAPSYRSFPGLEAEAVKARALSAELHHSPSFHYVHPQPHRSSFCVPLDNGADLAMVSEEMLLSAMPDRYDD